jgi:hypothetical protein
MKEGYLNERGVSQLKRVISMKEGYLNERGVSQ